MNATTRIQRLAARAFFALLLAAAFASAPPLLTNASAQQDSEEAQRDGDPVSIGTCRLLHSNVLGEDRPLFVCLPGNYEEGTMSYPVLFVLYGDQIRGYFAEAVHVVDRLSNEGSIPEMIIIGVTNTDRYRDLSPVERQGRPSGIEPFSRFVAEELLPFVRENYRTKDFRVLVGPQAGAEFGLYTLAKRPGLFDAFVLENPFRSPEVTGVLMTAMESILSGGLPSPTYVQIACVERAGHLDMTEGLAQARRFEAMIAEKKPQNLSLVVHYDEKNEDFIPLLRLKEGLRELFREYKFPDDREVRGLSDIVSYYAALSDRWGFEVDIPEMTLVTRADALTSAGSVDAAKEILEYLIDKHPASVNSYWRLANLHRERGDRDEAVRYYRKCLELMPNMGPARDWIGKLEAQR